MVGLGLSDDVIIDKIHTTQATEFDTSVAALRTLKAHSTAAGCARAYPLSGCSFTSFCDDTPGFMAADFLRTKTSECVT